MDKETVLRVLQEELRTNVRLRRELGMEEGDESGRVEGEDALAFDTSDGETFFISVLEG